MQLCVVDDRWQAVPGERGLFFLAQQWGKEQKEKALAAANAGALVIVDNGAFEGQLVSPIRLTDIAADLDAPGAIFVAPDYPAQPFAETLEAYQHFARGSQVATMLVPHSARGDIEGYIAAWKRAIEWAPACIGFSILAAPIAMEGHYDWSRIGQAGREELRRECLMCHVGPLISLAKEKGIHIHCLGLGRDWWNVAGYAAYGIDSIDSHKPASYADLHLRMRVGQVVYPRTPMMPWMISLPRQTLLEENAELIEHCFSATELASKTRPLEEGLR